jgi:hypothetical protein
MEGKILSGYKFEECVGQGSFGKVYRVSQGGKTYAIKSIELAKLGARKTAEVEGFFGNSIGYEIYGFMWIFYSLAFKVCLLLIMSVHLSLLVFFRCCSFFQK